MMRKGEKYILLAIMIFATLFTCCEKKTMTGMHRRKTFDYPEAKQWAHRTNDTAVAQLKRQYFKGLEVDVMYSSEDDELYIGHDEFDGMYKLTLEEWFAALPNPRETSYWIDMKNLEVDNADIIGEKIHEVTRIFNISDKVMVESSNWKALKKIKERGLFVILWVYSMNWNEENIDTATWYANLSAHVDYLEPDALSCEYRMYPLLPDSFPKQNIHFWHTPAALTEENAETTRTICSNRSVKVVLVDYDKPVEQTMDNY